MDGSRSKDEIMEEKVTKVNFLCLEQNFSILQLSLRQIL